MACLLFTSEGFSLLRHSLRRWHVQPQQWYVLEHSLWPLNSVTTGIFDSCSVVITCIAYMLFVFFKNCLYLFIPVQLNSVSALRLHNKRAVVCKTR